MSRALQYKGLRDDGWLLESLSHVNSSNSIARRYKTQMRILLQCTPCEISIIDISSQIAGKTNIAHCMTRSAPILSTREAHYISCARN